MENGEFSATGKSSYQALTEEEYEAVSANIIEFSERKLIVGKNSCYKRWLEDKKKSDETIKFEYV